PEIAILDRENLAWCAARNSGQQFEIDRMILPLAEPEDDSAHGPARRKFDFYPMCARALGRLPGSRRIPVNSFAGGGMSVRFAIGDCHRPTVEARQVWRAPRSDPRRQRIQSLAEWKGGDIRFAFSSGVAKG